MGTYMKIGINIEQSARYMAVNEGTSMRSKRWKQEKIRKQPGVSTVLGRYCGWNKSKTPKLNPAYRLECVKRLTHPYDGRPRLPSLHPSESSDVSWAEGWKRSETIPSSQCNAKSRLKRGYCPALGLHYIDQRQSHPHIHADERTSWRLFAYVQHEQSLLRLPVRRDLIREVRVHIHGEIPGNRLRWFNECELSPVAGNRHNEEVNRLRGVNIRRDAGEDHGTEWVLGVAHQQIPRP